MRQVNFKQMQKMLTADGWELDRKHGDHFIYKKNNRHVSINKNLNPCVALRLIKECGLRG